MSDNLLDGCVLQVSTFEDAYFKAMGKGTGVNYGYSRCRLRVQALPAAGALPPPAFRLCQRMCSCALYTLALKAEPCWQSCSR